MNSKYPRGWGSLSFFDAQLMWTASFLYPASIRAFLLKYLGDQHTLCTLLESVQLFEHFARIYTTYMCDFSETCSFSVMHVREVVGADWSTCSLACSLIHSVILANLKLRSSQILELKECTAI